MLDAPLEGLELPPLGARATRGAARARFAARVAARRRPFRRLPRRARRSSRTRGRRSLVFWTAFSALSTLSLSLLTAGPRRGEVRFTRRFALFAARAAGRFAAARRGRRGFRGGSRRFRLSTQIRCWDSSWWAVCWWAVVVVGAVVWWSCRGRRGRAASWSASSARGVVVGVAARAAADALWSCASFRSWTRRCRGAAGALTSCFRLRFLPAGEVGFGGFQRRLGLFEGDFGALRVERRKQLSLATCWPSLT